MGITQTTEIVKHPDGKILLRNGAVTDGYPATGNAAECRDVTALFKRNAWEIYRRREEIYADSRMFLAPLDVGCNLAYIGRNGIADATLGVWLEWWESLDVLRVDEKGRERLVYYFAGSPLSGKNCCQAVTPGGKDLCVSMSPFAPVWSTFLRINSRYVDPRRLFDAYTFEQTLKKLGLQAGI